LEIIHASQILKNVCTEKLLGQKVMQNTSLNYECIWVFNETDVEKESSAKKNIPT
jgi:hypothetical protein